MPNHEEVYVRVHAVGEAPDAWTNWQINTNLTDRWGDINYFNHENKPLEMLENDTFLEHLHEQMWSENTFIVRKDGKFGILFEVEYMSRESEAPYGDPEDRFPPHETVVRRLLAHMAPLTARFPGVSFCVPEESEIINDRPAAWAFVPDGHLSPEQREELGLALYDLGDPLPDEVALCDENSDGPEETGPAI